MLRLANSLRLVVFIMKIRDLIIFLALISTLIKCKQHLAKDKSGKKFILSIKKQDRVSLNNTNTESNDFSFIGNAKKPDTRKLKQRNLKGQEKGLVPEQGKKVNQHNWYCQRWK